MFCTFTGLTASDGSTSAFVYAVPAAGTPSHPGVNGDTADARYCGSTAGDGVGVGAGVGAGDGVGAGGGVGAGIGLFDEPPPQLAQNNAPEIGTTRNQRAQRAMPIPFYEAPRRILQNGRSGTDGRCRICPNAAPAVVSDFAISVAFPTLPVLG